MILLVSASTRARECAAAIEQKTHQKTVLAVNPALAVATLQEENIDAVVIDEALQHVDSGADSLIEAKAGMAVPVYINLSIHAAERVAHEVNCGLQRAGKERVAATRIAIGELRNELRGDITAILLNADLLLHEKSLAPGAFEKLCVIRETAERMRGKFDGSPVGIKAGALRPRLVDRAAITQNSN